MSDLIAVFKEIIGFLDRKRKRDAARKAQEADLIRALSRATNYTKAYIADRRRDAEYRNRDEERKLADLWMEVGLSIRGLSEKGDEEARVLYERCFIKGEYWSDPDWWTAEDIQAAGIRLDDISARVMDYADEEPVQ